MAAAQSFKKGKLFYEGKGKKLYRVIRHPTKLLLFFKDSLTAFQGRKTGQFEGKGEICRNISSLIFRYLKKNSIPTHWLADIGKRESLCLKTKIIPLEVVVRNRLAGSTAKRLGFKEGKRLMEPLLEFYYKKDELDDPFVSQEQIVKLKLVRESAFLPSIGKSAYRINKLLLVFFKAAGLELVDFKMEFGLFKTSLLLSDEISPDSCRLWDLKTGFRMDKDRFRRGWSEVETAYQNVFKRLGRSWKNL